MEQMQWDWLTQYHKQTEDYILLFSNSWKLLWKNKDCPVIPRDTAFLDFMHPYLTDAPPTSCMIPYLGELHLVQIDILPKTEHDADCPNPAYLVRIGIQSYAQMTWTNTDWCHTVENQLAELRNEISGISNATSGINRTIEAYSDLLSNAVIDDFTEQLNIIGGNCRKLTQTPTCFSEIKRYYQNQHIFESAVSIKQFLSEFVYHCRNVLGQSIEISIQVEDDLYIAVHPERLMYCLLFIISRLFQSQPDTTDLDIIAKTGEDQILLSVVSSTQHEIPRIRRHMTFDTPFSPDLHDMKSQAISLFCKAYRVQLLYASNQNGSSYTLRFPSDLSGVKDLTLKSPSKLLDDNRDAGTYSLFHLYLAEISNFRFF